MSDLRNPTSGLDRYTRRQFVAGLGGTALAAAFLAACGGGGDARGSADRPAARAPSTRRVQHALGETEIPVSPQRLVLLESTIMHVVALGVSPVGARNISRDERIHSERKDDFAGMVDFGGQDLDIELIIGLEPDLIIGTSPQRDDIYGQLSQIAPTVLLDNSGADSSAAWEQRLVDYADILGRQDTARDLLAAYDARIEDFRSRMGERLGTTLVSVVRSSNNEIQLCTKGGFPGSVLGKAGLRRPPSQDLDSAQTDALTGGGDSGSYPISLERLREADGDVLFLWANPSAAPRGDETQAQALRAKTEELTAAPLWRQLGAVQQGRFYEVGGHWRGFSVLEANLILDDLYRGVLEEEPS